jgi:hypothetical protein
MSLQTLAFLLGCGLIVIAIVGGGIEAKEVKVPKLSPIPRLLSAVFGIGLVVGAVGGLSGYANWGGNASAANAADLGNFAAGSAATNGAAAATAPAATPPPGTGATTNGAGPPASQEAPPPPVPESTTPPPPAREDVRTVRIHDELGPQQDYERIEIYVGGRRVALVAIDRNHRRQSIGFEVQAGDEYTLVGTEQTTGDDGVARTRVIRGSGTFDSTAQTDYTLQLVGRSAEMMEATIVPR